MAMLPNRGNSLILRGRLGPFSGRANGNDALDFSWAQVVMTAGTDGDQWVGYSDGGTGRPAPAFGSISEQPTAITDLLALYDDTNSDVYLAVFAGDYVSQMTGLALTVSTVTLTPFEAELIDGNTWLRYNGVGDLIDGVDYEVRLG